MKSRISELKKAGMEGSLYCLHVEDNVYDASYPATGIYHTHRWFYYEHEGGKPSVLVMVVESQKVAAGTIREIFQDLTQNLYETYGYASPMIFLGTKFRTEERPIYPLIRAMIDEKKLNQALSLEIFDENEQIILHLEKVF